ncbi:hypothetical protein NEOLEDRAFT_1179160 [Neolentinus lepideus HHB14362 ss-1]|uniref:Carbohydrate-binding module family 19 domain-containing protein n=1 Tax=Neolentinus lepideus HHB14362 ss-1 TaxID=1314782 RepID=A0A165RZM5_9AGAM|nr:hypothetical protein NEOLEDRAFT_1179160 [Neolentinus lepideus HHB14362 ss-1]
MVQLTSVFAALCAIYAVSAAPVSFQKRIAQTIADSTAQWEQACLKAGGGQQCNPISQTAFTSLLAAGKNCDQQDAADQMIDLAKQLNNDADMIRLAQIFVQQPRNAPDSLQVPYCETAPKNQELNGLFHCQFAGSNFAKFSGDQTGNVPLGLTAVNPPGSCPAKPDGPVPDGVQLNTLVTSPGTPQGGSSSGASTGSSAPAITSVASQSSATAVVTTSSAAAASTSSTANNSGSSGTAAGNTKSFTLSNGQEAQKLNAQFAALSASSSCTDGQDACVGGAFAQCVGGKFVTTQCAGGTQCFALPLVNSAGTSTTCTTEADAVSRIAATGATGGVTGNGSTGSDGSSSGNTASTSTSAAAVSSPAANNAASTGGAKSFTLSNGQDAQKLNAQFASLSASSSCTDGQNACVGGAFAQCVGGKFVTTQCAGGLQCFALPLVNSAGTSTTCTTEADAAARIAATGATGGVTGSN